MKILYILNQRFPTEKAYGIQVAKTCEALAAHGAQLELAVPYRVNSDQDPFVHYSIRRDFTFRKVFSPDFYLPGKLDRASFWIKNFISAVALTIHTLRAKAVVVYSREELPLYLLSFFTEGNLVFEAHNFSKKRQFFYTRFKNSGLRLIAISQGVKNDFVTFGFKPESILVVHDGVDLHDFENLPDIETIRKELELPADKKIVMYIGQLFAWKGADILVQCARLLDPDILVFIGGGQKEDIARLRKSDPTNAVCFEGPTSSALLPKYLRAADVLVLPNKKDGGISEFYTSPLKLFAYMAAQKPIVASDVASVREILNRQNAMLVKPNDPVALAEGINTVLRDQGRAQAMAQAAALDVKQYTWGKRAKNILDFLDQ